MSLFRKRPRKIPSQKAREWYVYRPEERHDLVRRFADVRIDELDGCRGDWVLVREILPRARKRKKK